MDRIKAHKLEEELSGKSLNEFTVISLINFGKSAAVFKADKDGVRYAIKIFDNELVQAYGHEIQEKRIEQEISLKGHMLSNLVKIFEGGFSSLAGVKYYFLVMEFIEGVNLKQFIQTKQFNLTFICGVLKNLFNISEKLLSQYNIVHRDIKPENIMIRVDGKVILMDLGVLKFIGTDSFSDEVEKSFVGTLRYAAPEFLFRKEVDSMLGWRAVNLYQIGATLHDLIMKKELFWNVVPYSNLIIAIKDDTPHIASDIYPFALLQLTRDMLSKDWKKRLELVPTNRIQELIDSGIAIPSDDISKKIDEAMKTRLRFQEGLKEVDKLHRTREELKTKQIKLSEKLDNEVDTCFAFLKDQNLCSSYHRSRKFQFSTDKDNTNALIYSNLFQVEGDLKIGYIRNLYMLIHISIGESNHVEIGLWGIIPSVFTKVNIDNPLKLFIDLAKENQMTRGRQSQSKSYNYETVNVFKGVIEFDEGFSAQLRNSITSLVLQSMKLVEKHVMKQIESDIARVSSHQPVTVCVSDSSMHLNIVISDF